MKISVVVPLYNKQASIREALCSVLLQSYQDFEVIVVNDGSTDCGAEIVRTMALPRVTLIEQQNGGVSAARNAGIRAASGEWVAFLDADDVWLPNNLACQVALLERNPDLKWCAGFFRHRLKGGREQLSLDLDFLKAQLDGEVVRDALALIPRGYLWTGAVMVRREVFDEIGFMDLALRTAEDLDMWLRIALRYPRLAYCTQPLASYTVEVPGSLTKQRVADPELLPHFLFARKHLPASLALPPERSGHLRLLARSLVATGIKKLLLSGYRRAALKAVEEFRELLGEGDRCRLRLFALAPAPLLRAGFAAIQTLKG